jgi:hypothetical protein
VADWTPQDCFAAVTGLAAVAGLFFTGFQIRQTRRATDLRTLQDFAREARDREQALAVGDESERTRAFNDYLNFLEIYAAAHNRNLFGRASRDIVRDKLIDVLGMLDAEKHVHPTVEQAVMSESSLTELRRFLDRHATAIRRSRTSYIESRDRAPDTFASSM